MHNLEVIKYSSENMQFSFFIGYVFSHFFSLDYHRIINFIAASLS